MIKYLTKTLRQWRKKNPFDAIAFRGQSGSAVAYPLSLALDVPLICVRKGSSHSAYKIEGCVNASRYIIVDDFIERGNTIRQIRKEIKNRYTKEPKLVGILLYNDCRCEECKITNNWKNIPIIPL